MSSKRIRDQERSDTVAHAIWLLCGRRALKEECEGVSLTPLEKQVVALRQSIPPSALLLVACGYRVKLYGRDSHVVSRRSGIMCIRSKPFEYSSVPYLRVELYVRRLVAMGYHVAFADQESAAVRASEGVKCGIFRRTVSHLYSRGTLLPGEQILPQSVSSWNEEGVMPEFDDDEANSARDKNIWEGDTNIEKSESSELFMCFIGSQTETTSPSPDSVVLETLKVVLVSFVTRSRKVFLISTLSALEDIVIQFDIVEVIMVGQGDRSSYSSSGSMAAYMEKTLGGYAHILQNALPLHYGPTLSGEEDEKYVSVSACTQNRGESFDSTIAAYLKPYKLDKMYEGICVDCDANLEEKHAGVCRRAELRSLNSASHDTKWVLRLPGSTLRALEVFQSSIGTKGSLLSLLDQCLTLPGARTLRLWLAEPLSTREAIIERQTVIAYLHKGAEMGTVQNLLHECSKFGDVEAIVAKIHSQRCSVVEYVKLLRMTRCIFTAASDILENYTPPSLLESLLRLIATSKLKSFVLKHSAEMDTSLSTPLQLFTGKGVTIPPSLVKHLEYLNKSQEALTKELEHIRELLHLPDLEYRTVLNTPFVIDIPSTKSSRIPQDWIVLTRTKTNVRYHTPTIVRENINLCAARDHLNVAATALWQQQQEVLCQAGGEMKILVDAIKAVAEIDALHSLSIVSSSTGYVCPQITEIQEDTTEPGGMAISIKAGRHPVLDRHLSSGYVSCDMYLRVGGTWLLTGPNMGGKSAFMRMVGCFVLMSQLGSYVPAEAATMPVFSGLYCRMGSSDAILEGNSTFFTEMEDTSRILRAPELSRSLVFMDELGRGTSSFDGFAVAAATLDYLVRVRSTCIFVTHYHLLCEPFNFDCSKSRPQAFSDGLKVCQNVESAPLVECHYMGFEMEKVDHTLPADREDCKLTASALDSERVVFTYKPCLGVTPSSFGIEVAKMAGLPDHVISEARKISLKEEEGHSYRTSLRLVRQLLQ